MNTADPVHFTLTPPECHMEIRNGYGTTGTRVAGPVHVGDPLTLMILMRSAWGKFLVTIVSFIPYFVFGFWSLLAMKLRKYEKIT